MRLKNLICSLGLALLLVGMLAACGLDSSTTGTSTSAPMLNSTPSTNENVPTPTASSVVALVTQVPSQQAVGSTPTSTNQNVPTPTASSVVVSVSQVPSHQAVGSTLTVLTTLNGFTLYVHEWQGTSGFTCDGSCAATWNPLVYNGTGTPTSATHLPGKLSVGTDAQGRHVVFYQGYPLYTYAGDTKPGDFKATLADNSPWQPATTNIPTGL